MDRVITPKNKSKNRYIAIAFALIVLLGLFYRMSSGSSNEQYIDRNSVTISSVKVGLFADTLNVRGVVMPKQTFYLDAIASGRVEEKMVEPGVFVEKGDPLLRFSNAELQLNVISREAQISEQLNFLRNTQMNADQDSLNLEREIIETNNQILTMKRTLKKYESLFAEKNIPEDDLIEARQHLSYLEQRAALNQKRKVQQEKIRSVQIKQLEESAIRLEENLEFTRNSLENLLVTAPVSGYLSELNVELGESKPMGSRLGQIDIPGQYKILASVDEYYLNLLNVGMSVKVELEGVNTQVQISKIDSRVNSGQFEIEIDLPPDLSSNSTKLKRGQSVELVLTLGESVDDSLLLTRGAFFMSTGGNWVFVLDKDNSKAHRRQIKLGMKNRQYYQVLTGLEEGDRIITSNYSLFDKAQTVILN